VMLSHRRQYKEDERRCSGHLVVHPQASES
jgi:hypothetical protein